MITRLLSLAAAVPALFLSAIALAQPVIVVLEHGEAPREEIRYRFATGPARQLTMTMEMRMTMSMGGQQVPAMAVPPISVPLSIRTTEVRADGSARFEYEMGEASLSEGGEVDSAMAQLLGASLGQIGGTTGWGWMDTRGNMLDGSIEQDVPASGPAAQLMGDMRSQIQQMSAPFPAEAVGVGARWQQTANVQMAGGLISQTAEYTLLSRDGDRIELAIKLVQSDSTPPPDAPPEAQAALAAMKLDGSGRLTVDLANQIPYSETTINSSSAMGGMPGQGQVPGMNMNMQIKMSIRPD